NPLGLGLPLEPREELRGARRISARRMRGSEERVQEVHFAEQRYRGRDRRNGAVAVATAGERGTEQPLGEDRVGAQFDGRAPVSYGAGAVAQHVMSQPRGCKAHAASGSRATACSECRLTPMASPRMP